MTTEPHPRHVAAPAEAILDEVERAVVGKRDVARARAARAARRRPRPARGRARRGQDADRPLVRRRRPGCASRRVQFTPDLLPSDVTGSSVFDQRTASFEFRPGPGVHATCCSATRSTAPRRRRRPRCWRRWRSARSPPTTARTSSSGPSSCSPRRTRSSTRAPTRCPRPSSTASWCACASATRRPTTSGACSTPARDRGTDAVALNAGHRPPTGCCACRPPSRPCTSAPRSGATWSPSRRPRARAREVEVGASPRGSLALLRLSRARAALEGRDFVVPDDVKAVAVPGAGPPARAAPGAVGAARRRRRRRAAGARRRAGAARDGAAGR